MILVKAVTTQARAVGVIARLAMRIAILAVSLRETTGDAETAKQMKNMAEMSSKLTAVAMSIVIMTMIDITVGEEGASAEIRKVEQIATDRIVVSKKQAIWSRVPRKWAKTWPSLSKMLSSKSSKRSV